MKKKLPNHPLLANDATDHGQLFRIITGQGDPLEIEKLKELAASGLPGSEEAAEALQLMGDAEAARLASLKISEASATQMFNAAKEASDRISNGTNPTPGDIYRMPSIGFVVVLDTVDDTSFRVMLVSANTHFALRHDVVFSNPIRKNQLAAHTRISGVIPLDAMGIFAGRVGQTELELFRQLHAGAHPELPQGLQYGDGIPDELYDDWRLYLDEKLTAHTMQALEDSERSSTLVWYLQAAPPNSGIDEAEYQYRLVAADHEADTISTLDGPVIFESADRIRIRAGKSGDNFALLVSVTDDITGDATLRLKHIKGDEGIAYTAQFLNGYSVIRLNSASEIQRCTVPIRSAVITVGERVFRYE